MTRKKTFPTISLVRSFAAAHLTFLGASCRRLSSKHAPHSSNWAVRVIATFTGQGFAMDDERQRCPIAEVTKKGVRHGRFLPIALLGPGVVPDSSGLRATATGVVL